MEIYIFFKYAMNWILYWSPTKLTGEQYKNRRRPLTPAFHIKVIEGFFDVFNEHSQELLLHLSNACKTTASRSSHIDVCPILRKFTLDILYGNDLKFKDLNNNLVVWGWEDLYDTIRHFNRPSRGRKKRNTSLPENYAQVLKHNNFVCVEVT